MGKLSFWLVRRFSDQFLAECVHQAAARVQVRRDPASRGDTVNEILYQLRTTSIFDLLQGLQPLDDKETAPATDKLSGRGK